MMGMSFITVVIAVCLVGGVEAQPGGGPGDIELPSDPCTSPPDHGPCTGDETRWFWSTTEQQCFTFPYGGCGGNLNNYMSIITCNTACAPFFTSRNPCNQLRQIGICRASIPRWYYDKDDDECKRFTYGGCGGNRNNFENKDECEDECEEGGLSSTVIIIICIVVPVVIIIIICIVVWICCCFGCCRCPGWGGDCGGPGRSGPFAGPGGLRAAQVY